MEKGPAPSLQDFQWASLVQLLSLFAHTISYTQIALKSMCTYTCYYYTTLVIILALASCLIVHMDLTCG